MSTSATGLLAELSLGMYGLCRPDSGASQLAKDTGCVSQRLRSSAGKMMQVFKCNKTYTLRIAICVTNFAHRCANVWADRRLIMKHCYSVLFSYNAKIIVLFDAGIHVESTCLKFCSLSDVYIMSWNKHRTLRFVTIRFRTDFKDWNSVQH